MNYIYIFNESVNASEYGIGTYIKQLTRGLQGNYNISLNVVILNSDKKEYEVINSHSTTFIHIPYITNFNRERDNIKYYRNAVYLLKEQIKAVYSDKLIFHFNYPNPILFRNVKDIFPNSVSVYTIHFDAGQSKDFHSKIKSNPQNRKETIKRKNIRIEMYKYIDHIICLSSYMKDYLMKDYSIPEKKISLIYNGIQDKRVFLSEKDKINLRKQLFISDNEKIITYVGRLHKSKGLDLLIGAYKKAVCTDKNLKLVLIGDGDFKYYLNLCNGFWGKIIFTGYIEQKQVYQFYEISDIGILPSFSEQCSYTAIEMMMHDLPIIGTTSLGLDDMIEDSDAKIDISQKDKSLNIYEDQLAKCILYNLNSKKQVKSYREIFLKKYSLDRMIKETTRVYNLSKLQS